MTDKCAQTTFDNVGHYDWHNEKIQNVRL